MSNEKHLQHYYKRLQYLLSKEFSQLSRKNTHNWKENKKQKYKLHPQWNQEISVTPNHRLWRLVSDFAKRRGHTKWLHWNKFVPQNTKSRNIKVSMNQEGQDSGGMITRSQFKKLSFLVLLLISLSLTPTEKDLFSGENTPERF